LLSLPAEGEDVPADDYMQSATGARMAATFGITARPSSPTDDRSSDSGSGSQTPSRLPVLSASGGQLTSRP
jgi:hypothetical protein